MLPQLLAEKDQIAKLCAKYGVERLDVFGSAVRGDGFDPERSDLDFLVAFAPGGGGLIAFVEFKDALTNLLGRPVDLVERVALEQSRNFIRRERIIAEAEPLYG